MKLTASKTSVKEFGQALESLAKTTDDQQVSAGINKNIILLNYQESFISKGFQDQVTNTIKGENQKIIPYPSHYCLIADCKMKPSSNLYYQIKNLLLGNVMVLLIKSYKSSSRTLNLRIQRA